MSNIADRLRRVARSLTTTFTPLMPVMTTAAVIGLVVGLEQPERVDELRPDDGIAADADGRRLPEPLPGPAGEAACPAPGRP